jgi:hypothetical protein
MVGQVAYADDLGRVALVPEGNFQFTGELERELQASSFEVVRLEGINAPLTNIEDLFTSLTVHQVTQGILLGEGGTQAVLVFIEKGELRVKGHYPVNQKDRLARRRLWIWIGEILRATHKEKNQAAAVEKAPIPTPELMPVPSIAPKSDASSPSFRPFSLGAASVLGYGSGSSFLGSHILLMAATPIRPRAMLFAHLLWPILSVGEKSSPIARSWAFQMQFGLSVYLGPLHSTLRPYAGIGLGVQVLFVELDSMTSTGGTTSSTGSNLFVGHLGTRMYISPRFALFVQAETGVTQSFTRGFDSQIASPANAWFRRVGLGIVFDR